MRKLKSKTGRIGWIRYEILLMIIIIGCIIYNITYESYVTKHNAISITNLGTISILHDLESMKIFEEQGRPIMHFVRNACEFIVVYTPEHEIHSIVMLDDVEHIEKKIVSVYDWKHILDSNEKGIIDLTTEGLDMKIHYRWVSFDSGEKYLVVYNINETEDTLFGIFNIMQYLTITLSFVVLISLIYWQHHGVISRYKRVNDEVQRIMRDE